MQERSNLIKVQPALSRIPACNLEENVWSVEIGACNNTNRLLTKCTSHDSINISNRRNRNRGVRRAVGSADNGVSQPPVDVFVCLGVLQEGSVTKGKWHPCMTRKDLGKEVAQSSGMSGLWVLAEP